MRERSPIFVRAARMAGAFMLIAVGIVGLFVPILPGWLLIVPGLALLAKDFTWAERLLETVRHRWAEARGTITRRDEENPGTRERRRAA